MKKNTLSTIALAAFVLLLSGSFAAAADYGDVSQNDTSATEGRNASASPATAAGAVDIDENDPRGPGRRRLFKPRPDPQPEPDDKGGRFTGICLNTPVLGQLFCWHEGPVAIP